jgi:hypothetical protein
MDHIERDLFVIFAFLGLTIVIGVLGVSVLSRLSKAGFTRPAGVTVLVSGLLLVMAFLSTFMPYVALAPIPIFVVFGMAALLKGGKLHRGGGIVLLLVGIAWSVFTAIQLGIPPGTDIRVDLLITLPIMAFVSFIGFSIFGALPPERIHGAGKTA